jgi:hypothetical protein
MRKEAARQTNKERQNEEKEKQFRAVRKEEKDKRIESQHVSKQRVQHVPRERNKKSKERGKRINGEKSL